MSDAHMSDGEENMSESGEQNEEDDNKGQPKEVYLPGKPLEEGEELVCDQSAYLMLHQAQTGAPCLSFDIVPDSLGNNRDKFPLTMYLVAGTQANQPHLNNIIVMKLSNMHRTGGDNDDEEEESEDEDDLKMPQMAGATIKHQGCVNRIRCTSLDGKIICASWSELGRVNLFNLSDQLKAVDNPSLLSKYNQEQKGNTAKPLFQFTGHQTEGFAIDWCSTVTGVLATGDCKKHIHIWHPSNSSWTVDQRPLIGHLASIEDLQWSPNEPSVLASCSVDKSIRIWDIRAPPNSACMLTTENAHTDDINVISWNRKEPFIVSGGDDGFLHIWDLRRFQEKKPIATFKHHTNSVTTVEWNQNEPTVFASGGSDNQIALWDLALEKDEETVRDEIGNLPPQLLFIHQGQTDVKELHWHPQLPGVIISTAQSNFNIFRTISV